MESSGAEVRKYCRCFKMLQNEYFLTCKIGFDTAANESSKVVRHLSSLFETFFVTLNLICTESPHPTVVLLTLGVGCGRAEPPGEGIDTDKLLGSRYRLYRRRLKSEIIPSSGIISLFFQNAFAF